MCPYRVLVLGCMVSAAAALPLSPGPGSQSQAIVAAPAAPDSEERTALEGPAAALKGRIVFDGDPPKDDGKLLAQMQQHKDKPVCCAAGADTADFTWRVNPDNKGVANAVVWVKPPAGKYFKPNTPSEKVWKKQDLTIDQPHCAFEPHVSVAFVSYHDGKTEQKTGQKIKVVNSAPVVHNSRWSGGVFLNPGDNPTIASKDEYDMTSKVKADSKAVIGLACNIHPWMRGYLWALDTPYYAVTDKDGKFEIKDLPAGTQVHVVKWHEAVQFFDGGVPGTKVMLESGTADLGVIKIREKK
jgi:hypothetical protein